jgi:predicted TIM-barrel fold metal-dependent hydrolase
VALSLVDTHVHAFPNDTVGLDWMTGLGVRKSRTGSITELGGLMAQSNIDRAVLLLLEPGRAEKGEHSESNIVSKETVTREQLGRIERYNRWGCSIAAADSRYIPFIGVDVQVMSDKEISEEIALMKSAGAKGVKIAPASMAVYPNDPLMEPVFRACVLHDLPLLSQSGDGAGQAPGAGMDPYGRPRYWDDVLAAFPQLVVILAHLGRGFEQDLVNLARKYPNVYTDTSMRLSGLGKPGRWTAEELVRMIRSVGADRVLFGSNFPFVNPAVYAMIVSQLPLTEAELAMVGHENFDRIVPVDTRNPAGSIIHDVGVDGR